jgi:hypothetical protein
MSDTSPTPPIPAHRGDPNIPADPVVPATPGSATSGPEMWAKYFPTATPEQLKKIMSTFINYSIQQMKQSQDQLTEAIKESGQDDDGD